MKRNTLNTLAKAMAILLLWTLTANALPCDSANTQGVSVRDDISPDSVVLGTNCLGLGQCDGGYCNVNLTSIKTFVDQIDDAIEFANFQPIACLRCATEAQRPADYKHGVCVYVRDLKDKAKVTARVVKENIDKLIVYGCGKCGASPIDGNDVSRGQIKVDFTRGACETGICNPTGALTFRSLDEPADTGVSSTIGITL